MGKEVRMKKLFSTILSLVLVLSYSAFGFAETGTAEPIKSDAIEQGVKKKIADEKKMFEIIGINADELILRHDGSSNKSEYMMTFEDGITNNIEISKTSNKEIRLDVFENDIHDIIMYSNDGTMTVNGEVVDFGNSIGGISPRGRTSVYSKKPQKGKSADYTKYSSTYKKTNINAKNKIKGLATGTIATIIAHALSASLPGSIAISTLGTLASDLKSAAEKYAPSSAYMSYSVKKYAYKNNTAIDKYYKHVGSYYVKKDCTGHASKANFYEYNYIQ